MAAPKYDSKDYTDVPALDAAVVLNEGSGLTIFALNKDTEDDIVCECSLRDFAGYNVIEHIALECADLEAKNSFAAPNAVAPAKKPAPEFADGVLTAHLPKLSWNVIRLAPELSE